MNSKVKLPKEGDLLFEKTGPNPLLLFALFVLFGWASINGIKHIPEKLTQPEKGLLFYWDILSLIIAVIVSIATGAVLYEGLRFGFNNETFKGHYFKDKIVFYRISRQIDENYTGGMTKEKILAEIIKVKDQIAEIDKQSDIEQFDSYMKKIGLENRLKRLEKGVIISENPLKPHKIELYFKDTKYFINEKDNISVVELFDNEEGDPIFFYNKLVLSKQYKNYRAEVVDFLNKQVESAKSAEMVIKD